MPGIRVRRLTKQVAEKELKIHFSNPKHGGGAIKKIYYPLPSNNAVIIFEERQVVDQVMKHEHPFSGELVEVEPLPENKVYSMIDAKLDAESSVIVQITPALRDEMEYVMAIRITQEPDQTYCLRGNWFQLEWAWHYIDQFMQQQEVIHHNVSKHPEQYAGQPMELDVSTDSPRNSRSEHKSKHQHPSRGNALLNDDKEIVSLSYRGDRNNASGDDHSNRERELPGDLDTEKSGVRSKSSVHMHALHDNSDTDDDQYLHGIGHHIPPESLQSITRPTYDNKRYQDENDTFLSFSGTDTTKLTLGGGAGRSRVDNGIQENAHHENNSSLQSQSPGASPSKSSYKSPGSDTEGSGRSTKPTIDTVDQSLSLGKSKFGPRLKNISRPYSEDQLLRTFDIRGLTVTVYCGSLIEEDTEAIVNAADEHLSHYGGISYAIKKARGHEMDDECLEYKRKHGNLKITEVMHTSGGGRIKALHIMHTAGPFFNKYSCEKFTFELTQTFFNCLEYAEERLHIKTLAFPAISTGVCGASLDTCVRCFLDAILIFTQQHGSSRRLADVRLVNNDAEKTNTSIALMQTLIDSGIESLTVKAEELLKKFTSKDREINFLTQYSGPSSFSKTYTTKTSSSFGITSHGSDVASSHRRRSGSLSRDSEKKFSTEDKRKDETAVHKSHSDRDNFATGTNRASWRQSDSEYSRHRERSGSSDRRSKNNPPSDFSKTVSGPLSYRDEGSSDRNSPKSTTVMPKMKLSLQHDVNEKLKSRRSTTVKDRLGVLSSADIGAFTHKDQNHTAYSRTFSDTIEDEECDYGMHSLPVNLHSESKKGAHSSHEKNSSAPKGKLEICAICLDEVKDPKQLPQCKHIFCRPCIQRHFASSKPSCPTCGALYGRVVGDQPEDGRMSYTTDRSNCLPGYESEDGMIIIMYTFPNGVQKYNHPCPGKRYKGLERKAYLPNSVEGREVLRLLKKAFDARLVFTIGDSKTSGRQDVLTWNDIHHKTSIAGGSTKFGYPDPGYLSRVKDELAAKGIVSDK